MTYEPHEFQREFHRSKARIRVVSTGRQSGKSLAGTVEALYWADQMAQEKGRPIKGRIIAPTYPMLSDINIPMLMDMVPDSAIKNWNKQEKRLELINGSEITFRSAEDPNKLRGWTGDWAWLDEGSFMDFAVWEVLQPGLVAKNGVAWITTTPQGKDWVFTQFLRNASKTFTVEDPFSEDLQQLVLKEDKKRNDDIHAFRYRSVDNPHLDRKLIESAKATMSEQMFKQEYLGSIEQFTGLVYPDFEEDYHLIDWNEADHPDLLWFMGIDVGFTNPTSGLLIAEDPEHNIYIVDEYYEVHKTAAEIVGDLKALEGGRQLTARIIDPAAKGTHQTSHMSMFDQFAQLGYTCVPGHNDVSAGINRVTKFFRNRDVKQPRIYINRECKNIISELHRYMWLPDKKRDGTNQHEKPRKAFDHAMDALRYAIMFRPDWFERPPKDRYGQPINNPLSETNLLVNRDDPDMY